MLAVLWRVEGVWRGFEMERREWWSSGVVEQWSGGKERVASDAATAGE